ncbi:hypothetical protein, conserved [Babesia bigemina]|uniref:Uncharacterized protein n=1 Tax=Babesia bigemina TaxID=5866 RepID=A0A061D9Z0_BABBI|nr:hypothetical protein, conserved [Babesia bigemina]CDR97531.1 hypothetical protein, conserved [Babesia bigemina]|eukprot:XP_012769717.1 hypothetical protein, conserved [Babesia bigemina]
MGSISANSLLVKCGVAAAVYYLPQDLGVLSILAFNKRSCSRRITGSVTCGPPETQVDRVIFNYMRDRGFDPANYLVHKGNLNTTVRLI